MPAKPNLSSSQTELGPVIADEQLLCLWRSLDHSLNPAPDTGHPMPQLLSGTTSESPCLTSRWSPGWYAVSQSLPCHSLGATGMFLDLLQAPQGPGEAGAGVGREISGPLNITKPHHFFNSIRPLPGGAGHSPRKALPPLRAGSRVLTSALKFPSLSHQPHISHSLNFDLEGGQRAGLDSPLPTPAPPPSPSSSPSAQKEFLPPLPHHVTYNLQDPMS